MEQRWEAQLAPLNLTMKYCPGARNGNADALSRQYREAGGAEVAEEGKECEGGTLRIQSDISVLPGCSSENLATLQGQDPVTGLPECWRKARPPDAKERERFGPVTKELASQWGRLREEEKVLRCNFNSPDGGKETYQLVLPQCL